MGVKLCVHECRLNESLTIVEYTVNLNGCDVLTEGSELALLNRTYLTLWIEYIDMDAVNTEESVSYGTTCIARSCYEYVNASLC